MYSMRIEWSIDDDDIQIDSRNTCWLKEFGFTFVLSAAALATKNARMASAKQIV
jgi:hypothetical protein